MSNERFTPLTAETMTADQKRVADAITSGPRGSMRGPFKALLRSPELADRVQRVGEYVRFHSSIPPRLNELAILIVARTWMAQFEWYAHRELAMKAGLSPAIADAIAVGQRPAAMAEDETLVYDFCSSLMRDHAVSDEMFAATKAKFGENGVMDLIGAMGYYSLVSMVLNTDRVSLPDGMAPPLKPLA